MQIIHLVANKTWGGGEQYVYDLIESLKKENWCNISVICKNYQAVTEKFMTLDVPLCHLKLNGYTDIKSIIALSKILKKQDEDTIIHTHDFKRAFIAIAARKLSGKKNIRIIMTRHLVRKAKKSFFENIVYKNIDKIIFVSQIAKDTCLSSSPKIEQAKCCVIHNGIKDKICDSKYLRDRYKIPNETFVLMYHGRIAKEKGIETIVDTLAIIKDKFDWRMVFVGDDTTQYANDIKKIIKNNGLQDNVIWTGWETNVCKYIGGCDCALLPSIVPEALGLSNVEYMMAGKTVITTDNGAQPEYINNNETGILVPVSAPDKIAETICNLYESKKYKEIGSNARQYYEQKLNYDNFIQKIIEIYQDKK